MTKPSTSTDRVVLLDSDIVAYKFAAAGQSSYDFDGDKDCYIELANFDDVLRETEEYIEGIKEQLKATKLIVCLSCPSAENFRMNILPSYKANRVGVAKPVYLNLIKDWMRGEYDCYEKASLEADDCMGILSTHPTLVPGKKVIVSEDKDMKTIPGWLFNPRKDTKAHKINELEADYWHLYQTLVGDATDNYKGCPGIGPVKATAILDDSEDRWAAVVATFENKSLTEEDALVQARVARILRATDYNFTTKEPILWEPQKRSSKQ